jgi:hypothetical protein
MNSTRVWMTTRQLTKCEYNSRLASKNLNPLASLARVLSPLTDPFYILASCLNWRVKFLTTRQFGECLEKLIHTPAVPCNNIISMDLALQGPTSIVGSWLCWLKLTSKLLPIEIDLIASGSLQYQQDSALRSWLVAYGPDRTTGGGEVRRWSALHGVCVLVSGGWRQSGHGVRLVAVVVLLRVVSHVQALQSLLHTLAVCTHYNTG